MFTGASGASRILTKDPESERRTARAFSGYAAETHRKEAVGWERLRISGLESV